MVQDFPLCATFREIDQQNSLVRGEMDNMREKLLLLDNLALEQVHLDCSPLARALHRVLIISSQVDRQQKEEVTRLAEQHREQLGAVQRQFRQANVKVCYHSEKWRFLSR